MQKQINRNENLNIKALTKKILLIGLILLQTSSVFSQIFDTDDITFELRHPIPIGNNFLNKDHKILGEYHGIIDLGIEYSILKKSNFNIGVLLNSSILRLSSTDVTLTTLSPKIKIDYKIEVPKFCIVPQIAIGYSAWFFRSSPYTFYDEYGQAVEIGKTKKMKMV